MFSTFLFYFILCRTKRYSGEEATNMIVVDLLSDKDDASSNESHLSSDSYSETAYSELQKETKILIMILLLLLGVLKSEEPYVPEGESDVSQLLDQLCKM